MEKKKIMPMVFLIDFDGTCTTHNFPNIGKEIGAAPVLKRLVASGHKLILFTMRSDNTNKTISADPVIKAVNGKFLTDAVNWFKSHDIPLWGIQTNPHQHTWTDSPKAFGDYMIDDIAIGTPLIHDKSISKQPFVDWVKMEVMLENMNLI
jgi:hypothetical protein